MYITFLDIENSNMYHEGWIGVAKYFIPITHCVMGLNIFSHPFLHITP